MYPTLSTAKLGDLSDEYYYGMQCQSCGHRGRISLTRLRSVLGDDFPLVSLRARLKCSQCGSRKATISFLNPGQRFSELAKLWDEPAV